MFPSFQLRRGTSIVDGDPAFQDSRLERRPLLASPSTERDPPPWAQGQRRFSADHQETLQSVAALLRHGRYPLLGDQVEAAKGLTRRLLERPSLARLGDLLDIHVPARSPQEIGLALRLQDGCRGLAGEALQALALQVRREHLAPKVLADALTGPGLHDRPPFLLALATAAMHDPALADAMCDLLTALSEKLGKAAVSQMLLTTDSALGCRSGKRLPEGLSEKYTDFLGRLIGDGLGEWGNEGAVRAIKRLNDAGLLPDKDAVRRRHSTQRWNKQARFVRICEDLAPRPPWNAAKPPRAPLERQAAMAWILAGAADSVTRAPARASDDGAGARGASAAAWESRIWRALDDTWQKARQQYQALLLHEVQLPSTGLPGGGAGGELRERCLPGLLRLGVTPSPQALDAVKRQVFDDHEVRDGLARSADLDDPRLGAAVEVAAREAARRLLDPTERLETFLTAWQLASCDLRHPPLARR